MEELRRARQLLERGVPGHISLPVDIELAPRSECVQFLSSAKYKAKTRIAMKLPPDYLDFVSTAADVLIGGALR